jgi:hypothetical protein
MTTPGYTPTQWLDTANGNTPLSAANLNKIEGGIVGAYTKASSLALNPTIIRTGSYTLNYNDFGRFDCSAQNITSTLPAASVGALIGVKKTDATSNTATFNPAGSDVINNSASPLVLRIPLETRMLVGISGGWVTIAGNTPVSSLDLRYAAPPLFHAVAATTQSIPNDTPTAVNFTAETYDTASGHSTSSQTSRYVAQKAGYYQCSGAVAFQFNNTTGSRAATLYKNGVLWAGSSGSIAPVNGLATRVVTTTTVINLALNDYVELWAYHNAGIATSTEATATNASSLSVAFLAPT